MNPAREGQGFKQGAIRDLHSRRMECAFLPDLFFVCHDFPGTG